MEFVQPYPLSPALQIWGPLYQIYVALIWRSDQHKWKTGLEGLMSKQKALIRAHNTCVGELTSGLLLRLAVPL